MLNYLATYERARADLGLASTEASTPNTTKHPFDAIKTPNAPLPLRHGWLEPRCHRHNGMLAKDFFILARHDFPKAGRLARTHA